MATPARNSALKKAEKVERQPGWLGVVGTADGRDRLRRRSDLWWCLPDSANPGALVAMYLTKQRFGSANAGIFALFTFTGFIEGRDAECADFGSRSGHGALRCGGLELLRQLSKPLQYIQEVNRLLQASKPT